MKCIKGNINKTFLLALAGIVVIIISSFAIQKSLKTIYTNSKYQIAKSNKLQIDLIKTNLKNYLITNKNLLDSIFLTIPDTKPKTMITLLDRYLLKSKHGHVKNIFFLHSNKLTLLYPHISKIPLPITMIKNYKEILNMVATAKKEKKSLYFTAPMLHLEEGKEKNVISLLLLHPIFIEGNYAGTIIESIDISSKLKDIFKYLRNYSVEISYKPEKTGHACEIEKLTIDKASFYIIVNKKNELISKIRDNIKAVTVNLIVILFISILIIIFISILLIKNIKKEAIYQKTLSQLNRRIDAIKAIIAIKENFTSKTNITTILKTLNKVFDTDISGIFIKKNEINYVLKSDKIMQINFLNIENSLSRLAWEKKEDIVIDDFQKSDMLSQKTKELTKTKSAMCALLHFKDSYYGVICVADTRKTGAFNKEDFNFLKLIADILSINIYYSNLDRDAIEALLNAIEARDRYTEGHSRRVGEYARFIAKILGFDETYQNNIYKAGLFHDVGKIGIPDVILLKPSKLSPHEYKIMKMHSVFSYEILKHVEMLSGVIKGIRGHHERWDGKGYPDGLKGKDIPLEARILTIADSFDAIITSRPYKSAMTLNKAKEELIKNAGGQFDPEIIKKIEPHIEEMYNMGKEIEKQKTHIFPENIEEVRKNIFFTDWLTGLYTMEKLERIISELIIDDIEFSLCNLDIVNFSKIRYERGKTKATDLILKISSMLKETIGNNVARYNEDNFTFILKSNIEPEDMLEELSHNIKQSLGCDVELTYVSYPKDGKTTDELLYKLKVKTKQTKGKRYTNNFENHA